MALSLQAHKASEGCVCVCDGKHKWKPPLLRCSGTQLKEHSQLVHEQMDATFLHSDIKGLNYACMIWTEDILANPPDFPEEHTVNNLNS